MSHLRAGGRAVRAPAVPWGKGLAILVLATWAAGLAIGFQTALLVLMLVGFGAAVIGLRRPVLGLLGISMLCTLDSVSRLYLFTGGLWRWNTFNYWLLAVMLLSIPFLLRLRDPQTKLIELLILLLIVELLFSNDLTTGVQHVLNVATLFGLLAYLARAARNPEQWYWVAIVNGLLAGLGSLVFYLKEESLLEVNPNAWSFFPLTAIFCIALSFSIAGSRRGRFLRTLLAGINGAWVFLSGSRGSSLIALACLIFIIVQLRRSGRAVPILAISVLVAIGLASQFIGQESFAVHKFRSLFDTQRSLTNRTSGRSELAKGGWRIFEDHPFGVGTGGFADAWANLRNLEGMSEFHEGEYTQAHSGWIKILAENGIPGILLLAGFVLSFAIIGWRGRSTELFLLGLLVTVSLSVAFLADEFQGKGLWFLAGTAMTVLRRRAGPAVRFSAEVDRQDRDGKRPLMAAPRFG